MITFFIALICVLSFASGFAFAYVKFSSEIEAANETVAKALKDVHEAQRVSQVSVNIVKRMRNEGGVV